MTLLCASIASIFFLTCFTYQISGAAIASRRCMRFLPLLLIVSLLAIATSRAAAASYGADPGSHAVATLDQTWHDEKRNRDVPVLICYPADLADIPAAVPVIIFSHGLGGSRTTYQAYGQHWASYGYVVIFPQHIGSDTSVIGRGMHDMLLGKNDLKPFLDRVGDIHFVIDQIEQLNAGSPPETDDKIFKGKLNLKRIGMSGHSFGAQTTQAIVGQRYVATPGGMADPRIKAGIAMSGSGKNLPDPDRAFGSIAVPVLYLTGTADRVYNTLPAMRRIPFDHSHAADAFLITFDGGTHMTFGPRGLGSPNYDRFQKLIREATTAFWDWQLKDDPAAKRWFLHDLAGEIAKSGRFEVRLAGSAPATAPAAATP